MTRKLLVGAIVAGALTVTAGTAFALSQGDQSSSGAASATSTPTSLTTAPTTAPSTSSSTPTSTGSAPARLTADDAARIAQARVGGTVHEIEREVEHGRLEWKVEITGADGVTYDMRIDAVTGDLTRVDQDDDRGGDDDRDDDRDDDHGRHGGDDRGDDHDDD